METTHHSGNKFVRALQVTLRVLLVFVTTAALLCAAAYGALYILIEGPSPGASEITVNIITEQGLDWVLPYVTEGEPGVPSGTE